MSQLPVLSLSVLHRHKYQSSEIEHEKHHATYYLCRLAKAIILASDMWTLAPMMTFVLEFLLQRDPYLPQDPGHAYSCIRHMNPFTNNLSPRSHYLQWTLQHSGILFNIGLLDLLRSLTEGFYLTPQILSIHFLFPKTA